MYLLNYIFLDPIWHFANFLKHPNWIIQLEESGMVQTAPFAKLAHKHDQINGLSTRKPMDLVNDNISFDVNNYTCRGRHKSVRYCKEKT